MLPHTSNDAWSLTVHTLSKNYLNLPIFVRKIPVVEPLDIQNDKMRVENQTNLVDTQLMKS